MRRDCPVSHHALNTVLRNPLPHSNVYLYDHVSEMTGLTLFPVGQLRHYIEVNVSPIIGRTVLPDRE